MIFNHVLTTFMNYHHHQHHSFIWDSELSLLLIYTTLLVLTFSIHIFISALLALFILVNESHGYGLITSFSGWRDVRQSVRLEDLI
jgi:hypothetical protein